MPSKRWLCICMSLMFLFSGLALADEHGRGHGKHHGDDDERGYHRGYYSDHYRDAIRGWYREQDGHLPPGLAKRDRLPPGLERQLQVRGTLPPGLQKKMMPVPVALEQRLPPPPPDCAHVFIGANLVLVNRRTNVVLDIFQF